MTAGSDNQFPKIILEEVADDGSATVTPAADHRALFLGEDGTLRLKDSAAAVTEVGGGGGVTVQDEGTPLATTATTLNFVGAGVAATGAGATKTITIAGGGSSDLFPLDVAPGSPSAFDDEGTGSLPGIWTDPITSAAGQTNTITRGNGWTYIEPATAGTASTGKRIFGIRQTCPAGSFSVSAKVFDGMSEDFANTDDGRSGIFVATTGGNAHVLGHQSSVPRVADYIGVTGYSESADWGGFDGSNTSEATLSRNALMVGTWYKLDWNAGSTTLTYYFSQDGIRWHKLGSRNTGVAQPDRIGICIYANGADVRADHQLAYRWFRVV